METKLKGGIKMSKHTNYRSYSKPVDEVIPENVKEKVNEVIEEAVEPVIEEVVKPAEPTTGKVARCNKLRVRKSPSPLAEVLCEIAVDTKVIINESDSTIDFYKVCTGAGVEGYCMKKFIELK